MFVFNAHVSVTYQTHNSKLLKQLKFWLNFWPPRKWSFATTFMLQKYQNYGLKIGKCYHTTMVTNDYYTASVCLAFLKKHSENPS